VWTFPASRGGSFVYKSSMLGQGCTRVFLIDKSNTIRNTSARFKSANDKEVQRLLGFCIFILSIQQFAIYFVQQ